MQLDHGLVDLPALLGPSSHIPKREERAIPDRGEPDAPLRHAVDFVEISSTRMICLSLVLSPVCNLGADAKSNHAQIHMFEILEGRYPDGPADRVCVIEICNPLNEAAGGR